MRALLEEAIVTERHPRTMIHVVLQALGDDGGLLACALNVRRLVWLVGDCWTPPPVSLSCRPL